MHSKSLGTILQVGKHLNAKYMEEAGILEDLREAMRRMSTHDVSARQAGCTTAGGSVLEESSRRQGAGDGVIGMVAGGQVRRCFEAAASGLLIREGDPQANRFPTAARNGTAGSPVDSSGFSERDQVGNRCAVGNIVIGSSGTPTSVAAGVRSRATSRLPTINNLHADNSSNVEEDSGPAVVGSFDQARGDCGAGSSGGRTDDRCGVDSRASQAQGRGIAGSPNEHGKVRHTARKGADGTGARSAVAHISPGASSKRDRDDAAAAIVGTRVLKATKYEETPSDDLPVHAKAVHPMNFDLLVEHSGDSRFKKLRNDLYQARHLRGGGCFSNLRPRDIQDLMDAGLIEEAATVSASTFLVPEPFKGRARFILWPKALNVDCDYSSEMHLTDVKNLVSDVHKGEVGFSVELSASFYHVPLSPLRATIMFFVLAAASSADGCGHLLRDHAEALLLCLNPSGASQKCNNSGPRQ